jgi:hypothetical protein
MRFVAVVTCVVALAGFSLWLFGPKSAGTFGLTFGDATQATIISIDGASPFKHDGVRVGDVIRFDRMPVSQRVALTNPVAGIAATIAVERAAGIATFSEVARPSPPAISPRQIAVWILVFLYAAMTTLIAWRAPRGHLRTVIMFVIAPLAVSYAVRYISGSIFSTGAYAVSNVIADLGLSIFIISQFVFIVSFPPRSTPALRWLRLIGFPLTVTAAAFYSIGSMDETFRFLPFDVTTLSMSFAIPTFVLWIAGIVDGAIGADKSYRTPALVAGSTLFVLSIVDLAFALTTLFGWNAAWETSLLWLQWASGFGVSYAVLRHKLLDLDLVISRAAIFSTVSLCLVASFVIAEWALGTMLERAIGPGFGENARTALAAFVALCVGFSARGVHSAVEHRLNRVFFAKRYRALADLHRFALETDAATDSSALLDLTISALRRNLASEYVALYTGSSESGYVAAGTSAALRLPLRLDQNEEVVLRLRRWGEPFVVESESHPIAGAYVCPMMLRGALYGFAICGPKQDRSSYVPDERDAIASLAHRVGIAYEWLTRSATTSVTR